MDGVGEIPLTRGKVALVDAEDYEALVVRKWFCSANGYAVRTVSVGGKRELLRMHRALLNPPDGCLVDHINGDTLDNRKSNLRHATQQQNQYNRGPQRNNTTGFKGVTFDKHAGKYSARIWASGKQINLGLHTNPEEAHAAYCAAALELHGEFSRTA